MAPTAQERGWGAPGRRARPRRDRRQPRRKAPRRRGLSQGRQVSSGLGGDLADLDAVESDRSGHALLDPLARLLRRIFRLEDDHREPVVVLPRPIAGYETRRLRYARDDFFTKRLLG